MLGHPSAVGDTARSQGGMQGTDSHACQGHHSALEGKNMCLDGVLTDWSFFFIALSVGWAVEVCLINAFSVHPGCGIPCSCVFCFWGILRINDE